MTDTRARAIHANLIREFAGADILQDVAAAEVTCTESQDTFQYTVRFRTLEAGSFAATATVVRVAVLIARECEASTFDYPHGARTWSIVPLENSAGFVVAIVTRPEHDIQVGDRVEHRYSPELDARPVKIITRRQIWLTGPSGQPMGPFPRENYRFVSRPERAPEPAPLPAPSWQGECSACGSRAEFHRQSWSLRCAKCGEVEDLLTSDLRAAVAELVSRPTEETRERVQELIHDCYMRHDITINQLRVRP